MASKSKTVHFFSVQILESTTNLREILDNFFSEYGLEGSIRNAENNQNINTSIVKYTHEGKEHTIEKILTERETYFIRLGKERSSGSITKRDINTSNSESILVPGDEGVKYLEELTHLLIDTRKNLIAYLGGIGGAKPYLLKHAIKEKFLSDKIEILPIIEQETLKKILKKESLIDELTLKFAAPHPLALKELGLNKEFIEKITRNESIETSLTIKSKEKKTPLFSFDESKKSLSRFLDKIIKNNDVNAITVKGKENSRSKKREFSLNDLYFTEKVNVKFSELVGEGGREKILYDYEYSWECNNKMSEVFNLDRREYLYMLTTQMVAE